MKNFKTSTENRSNRLQPVIDINRAPLKQFRSLNLGLGRVGNGFHRNQESKKDLRKRAGEVIKEVKASRNRLRDLQETKPGDSQSDINSSFINKQKI